MTRANYAHFPLFSHVQFLSLLLLLGSDGAQLREALVREEGGGGGVEFL